MVDYWAHDDVMDDIEKERFDEFMCQVEEHETESMVASMPEDSAEVVH